VSLSLIVAYITAADVDGHGVLAEMLISSMERNGAVLLVLTTAERVSVDGQGVVLTLLLV